MGRNDFFYRATLCVSAVFAVARCPSVLPYVCHVRAFYSDGWRECCEAVWLARPNNGPGRWTSFMPRPIERMRITDDFCRFAALTETVPTIDEPPPDCNRKPYPLHRMVPPSMTLTDFWPWLQGFYRHWVSPKRHVTRQSHSYYRTSIGSHMISIEWWYFQWS